jgi:hypothetical protein
MTSKHLPTACFTTRQKERPNEPIVPAKAANGVGEVGRRQRLGGLLSFYYREAA